MKAKKLNTILGWGVFLISLIVYWLTIEPSVSFWDCGEFISSSYKLQVGHPPGAPFFQIIQRVFSLLAPNEMYVAYMMNLFSAISSAATIMFLYWTIVLLAMRIPSKNEGKPNSNILIYAAGAIGSLTFAFTDTFWFSTVEAEVYALSSLFTAVVFWAILKWERVADEPHSSRWVLLIMYLIGLSIGVHLLNLLAIPAIALIWYFKKHKTTIKGVLVTLVLSAIIILFIMFGMVQGTPQLAESFDVFFVNTLGLPYNSGLLFLIVLLIAVIVALIVYSHKAKRVVLNMLTISVALIYIGFFSYTLIIIRAGANPPMNENNPANAYSLMQYLNRSQYGTTPVVSGYYYNAPATSVKAGKPVYYPQDGKYVKIEGESVYSFDDRFKTVFPRMFSSQDSHVQGYGSWGKVKGRPVLINGETEMLPKFSENLRYFFSYQLNHMYIRYFMWNFSGRQNDIQGHGDIFNGNWLSGIGFIDKARLGHNGSQPASMSNPETTNRYFMLPFLLGLIGLLYQLQRNKKDFWVVMALFFMTGIAIVLYLNQPPYQPRERDYAYAGSFYTFAIWIGLGVMSIHDFFSKWMKNKAIIPAVLLTLVVPILVLAQNYNDHDRSGRYVVRDLGKNYLNSCEKNAILFTYGDNDTFPLWYVQDVENERPDVRICNVTLLNSDWYIEQMTRKVYDSDPLPISMQKAQYANNLRSAIFVRDEIKKPVELSTLISFALNDNPRSKVQTQAGRSYDFFPTQQFKITVDKAKVLSTGTVPAHKAHLIEDSLIITSSGSYLGKSDLAILDILANNNWERPIYFDLSVIQTTSLKLENYLQNEGLAFRFVPIFSGSYERAFDTDLLYGRLMEDFNWENFGDRNILIDDNLHRTTEIIRIKRNFHNLSEALAREGKIDSAIQVLDRVYEIMPIDRYYTSYNDVMLAIDYFNVDENNKATEILKVVANDGLDKIEFYLSLGSEYVGFYQRESNREISIVREILSITQQFKMTELNNQLGEKLNTLLKLYE